MNYEKLITKQIEQSRQDLNRKRPKEITKSLDVLESLLKPLTNKEEIENKEYESHTERFEHYIKIATKKQVLKKPSSTKLGLPA